MEWPSDFFEGMEREIGNHPALVPDLIVVGSDDSMRIAKSNGRCLMVTANFIKSLLDSGATKVVIRDPNNNWVAVKYKETPSST